MTYPRRRPILYSNMTWRARRSLRRRLSWPYDVPVNAEYDEWHSYGLKPKSANEKPTSEGGSVALRA